MKRTGADLMGTQADLRAYSRNEMLVGGTGQSEKSEYQAEQVFIVSLVLDLSEVEVLDQKAVIEKRVIARSRREALDKCGFRVTG